MRFGFALLAALGTAVAMEGHTWAAAPAVMAALAAVDFIVRDALGGRP